MGNILRIHYDKLLTSLLLEVAIIMHSEIRIVTDNNSIVLFLGIVVMMMMVLLIALEMDADLAATPILLR